MSSGGPNNAATQVVSRSVVIIRNNCMRYAGCEIYNKCCCCYIMPTLACKSTCVSQELEVFKFMEFDCVRNFVFKCVLLLDCSYGKSFRDSLMAFLLGLLYYVIVVSAVRDFRRRDSESRGNYN